MRRKGKGKTLFLSHPNPIRSHSMSHPLPYSFHLLLLDNLSNERMQKRKRNLFLSRKWIQSNFALLLPPHISFIHQQRSHLDFVLFLSFALQGDDNWKGIFLWWDMVWYDMSVIKNTLWDLNFPIQKNRFIP